MFQILFGWLIITICILAGFLLRLVTGWPVPVPVWGMVVLLVASLAMGGVPASVRLVGEFLFRHMALFFIPPVLGVVTLGPLLQTIGWHLAVAIIVSTWIGLWATAFMMSQFLEASSVSRARDEREVPD
jgi:holin-like protein